MSNETENTALVLETSDYMPLIEKLEAQARRGALIQSESRQFVRMVALGQTIKALRDLLDGKVMEMITYLQGRAIGFRTDKDDKEGYSKEVVKDCLIEAILQGVYPVGNEFNIIAGRCYITKEGLGRKLREIEGLRYYMTAGIPARKDDRTAIVAITVNWNFGGAEHVDELSFSVRVNAGMGDDGAIGKAMRKARAWLYQRVTGYELADGEVGYTGNEELPEGEIDAVPSTISVTARRAKARAAAATESGAGAEGRKPPVKAEGQTPPQTAPSDAQSPRVPTPLEEVYILLDEALDAEAVRIADAKAVQYHNLGGKITISELEEFKKEMNAKLKKLATGGERNG